MYGEKQCVIRDERIFNSKHFTSNLNNCSRNCYNICMITLSWYCPVDDVINKGKSKLPFSEFARIVKEISEDLI